MVTPVTYPRLIRRVKAVAFDSVFIPILMFMSLLAGDALGLNVYLKVILFFIPLLIFEPLLVSLTGGSVGHHLLGLKITRLDGKTHLSIFAATLRLATKLLLGAFSFIFVMTTKRHQAIHDLVSRSLVINKNPETLAAYEVLDERTDGSSGYVQKSTLRRSLVILVYCLLILLVVTAAMSILLSDQCMRFSMCTSSEKSIELAVDIILLLAIGTCVVQGWRGVLFGARRVTRNV